MPRRPRDIKYKHGRPKHIIDWNVVDKMLEGGADGTHIAARLGMHPDTLYDRCYEEKGSIFSAYAQEKRAKGDGNLHLKQYSEAMSGNITMLIWLGKQRLNQSEKKRIDVTSNGEKFVQAFLPFKEEDE